MIKKDVSIALEGFILLPLITPCKYHGVDRDPFGLEVIAEEMQFPIESSVSEIIWSLYQPGWRRDAYHIFEDNSLSGSGKLIDLSLLSSYEAAREIQQIIHPFLGHYEIVHCCVWEYSSLSKFHIDVPSPSLGYDIAYPGGDFFSAIRDGLSECPRLHTQAIKHLVVEYGHWLNHFGLFTQVTPIKSYLHDYWKMTPYEENRSFCVYWLDNINIRKLT